MCGGDLELTENSSIATCEYCGTQQTVPTQDSEKKLVQFERADRLRRNCEFDKAANIYENIVADFRQEAEGYWGLVLCKYGIEYVDDPASGKKVPTCHRSSFESIMDDPDFEQTLENADSVSRKVYRDEAKKIEDIRKGIIEVSANEDPYDIFICYKETAADGQRTVDSVLAQDIYDALINKGYRVFFSRITLEDKLGQEYEPYIFAALNSAKVMLAIGTDYEHYNAVWVKNEWSRYLKLMENDKSKHLIPCFKDIDAYDMPKEFSKLQAQDLGKVGALQDLLRGIDKLISAKPAVQATAGIQSDDVNRIYIYNSAMEDMKSKKVKRAKAAVKKLESLGNWNDAPLQLEAAKKHLKKRKGARTVRRIITWLIILGILGSIGFLILNQFKSHYDSGVKYMEQGKYAHASHNFDQAAFYKNAEQLKTDTLAKAEIADEELRALINDNGEIRFFFGENWLDEMIENNSIREGDVVLDQGNSYNGYMESVHAEFIINGTNGIITYLTDQGNFLFTPSNGSPQTLCIENGSLIMEDGTIYSGAGTVMQEYCDIIAAHIESKNFEQASVMTATLAEMVGCGLLDADQSVLDVVTPLADNAVALTRQNHDLGIDMLFIIHELMLKTFNSGNVTDTQAAYNAAESIVNAVEQMAKNGFYSALEILMFSMEYAPMAQAGMLGDDSVFIEKFMALSDRCQRLITEGFY